MRLANIPLVLAMIVAAWLLTGLVVGQRRWLQALAAGVVALNAQLYSVSGAVNADVLLSAGFSVAMVLMALILLRGPTRGRVIGLLAAGAVAALSHPRGLPIVVPVLLTLAIAWWRARAPHTPRARRTVRAGVLA